VDIDVQIYAGSTIVKNDLLQNFIFDLQHAFIRNSIRKLKSVINVYQLKRFARNIVDD
jgi:hypothetical protein